jgi:hypothetical protein
VTDRLMRNIFYNLAGRHKAFAGGSAGESLPAKTIPALCVHACAYDTTTCGIVSSGLWMWTMDIGHGPWTTKQTR